MRSPIIAAWSNWKRLHRLAYLAVPLAIVHYAWAQKSDIRQPLLLGAAVALLLVLRLPPLRRRIETWRRALVARRQPASHRHASVGEARRSDGG
jgi:sulfoxide reductase heme-binding subunit YedZ